MTVKSKKDEFLTNAIKAYQEINLNYARQSAEAFCKLIILKEFDEVEGEKIINKEHEVIKGYSFDEAVKTILFKNKARNEQPLIHKKMKSILSVLQNHGNLGSHNEDKSKLDMNEKEYALFNLTKLVEFLYKEYLKENIPNELESLLIQYENKLHEKVEKSNKNWLNIKEITNDFSEVLQKFILITDKCNNNTILSNLSNIPWAYIGDFDKDSHKSGLLLNLKDEISQYRDYNIITLEDKINYSKSTTFWDFILGYSEREETLVNNYRNWQKKYYKNGKVEKHLKDLYIGGVSTSDIFIFIFWENEETLDYLFDYLTIIDDIFIDATKFIFSSSNKKIREKFEENLEEYENIRNYLVCNLSIENFSILLQNKKKINIDDIQFPARIEGNDSSIVIEAKDFLRYKDDLKIFPYEYVDDSLECTNYYKGKDIGFLDLHNECDVERTIKNEIESVVRNRLNNRNNQLIYILSEPSAGATSILNRILWNIKGKYPSFELLNYKKQNTYEFLQKIYTNTNKPILILADYKIHEENIKNLVNELNTKRITYVILYVNRFLDIEEVKKYEKKLKKSPSKLPFIIMENLDSEENNKFYRKLAKEYNNKQDLLLKLRNNGNNSPFKYCFTVFLNEYDNLENYVNERLEQLNDFQKNRTKFLALIQYYTGLDVTIKFLTKKVSKYSLYSSNLKINSLVIYTEAKDELKIKFIHNIICKEILQNLSGVVQKSAWKQKLLDIGIDFLNFIEKEHKHNKDNEVIKNIVNRLFIKRNITTYDSENKDSIKYYTDFIEDLSQTNSSTDAREKIFQKLIEIYPEDRHIIAHLGRFYSVDRKNFKKSLEYINMAIDLAEDDGNTDSILYHMKGMAYFRELKNEIINKADMNIVLKLGKFSAECFETSREYDTQINNEYPFLSHADMLLAILKYGKEQYNDIYNFINKYGSDDFVSNIIDNIENLISDFEVIRTKSDNFSDMSRIQTKLWELQGEEGKSLQMLNNLLDKNTHDNSVIKRNIVRLNFKKYEDNIHDIPIKKVKTLIDYLKDNLDNFSLKKPNSSDLLLWLRLIRHKDINLQILDIAPILAYIKSILDEENTLNKVQKNIQIITLYYLHIIKFIQYYQGDKEVYSEFIEIKKELKNKAMYLDGKSLAREWLYSGDYNNLKKVINWYDKRLKWVNEDKFFNLDSEKHLEKCKGIIKEVQSQKNGIISYKNIDIHFIPRNEFTEGDINKEVEFYLSFSYDDMSAWKVIKI